MHTEQRLGIPCVWNKIAGVCVWRDVSGRGPGEGKGSGVWSAITQHHNVLRLLVQRQGVPLFRIDPLLHVRNQLRLHERPDLGPEDMVGLAVVRRVATLMEGGVGGGWEWCQIGRRENMLRFALCPSVSSEVYASYRHQPHMPIPG